MPKFIEKKCGRVTYCTPDFSSGAEKEGTDRENPAIFNRMEETLKENEICDSVVELDFLKIECFGTAPKSPIPIADPGGYVVKEKEIREAYQGAWVKFWSEKIAYRGLPAQFTVYLEDLPNPKASYEICGTALLQREGGKKAL